MSMKKHSRKRYLGDGVYADFDGHNIILTTEDGVRETNRIYLEGEAMYQLDKFYKELIKEQE